MDKLKGDRGSSHERHLPSFPESSPTKPSYIETRVSFEPSLSGGSVNGVPESVRRQCKEDGSLNRHQRKQEQEREEVLKCSSNASFPRQANPLSRLKTKSRLLYDPSPEELERMSGRVPKSGTMRSGILSRVFDDEDDEDPLEDVDLPDEYKKDKIQESLFNQFVIEALSGPPLIEIQKAEDDAERIATEVLKLQNVGATIPENSRNLSSHQQRVAGEKEGDGGITIGHLHKLNTKNISAWNMKKLMKIVRHGSLSTLDEQILESPVSNSVLATKSIEVGDSVEFHESCMGDSVEFHMYSGSGRFEQVDGGCMDEA
ncbi:mechanosensitive ion channel protein [Salix suchowensis]|nr:mechanosensitive ion channel protein [Salix suchowensis]